MVNRIDFENVIFKNEKNIQGENKVYYSLRKYENMGFFDMLKDISENINLVKLMDSLVNVSHAISVLGYWIFDSKYEKSTST